MLKGDIVYNCIIYFTLIILSYFDLRFFKIPNIIILLSEFIRILLSINHIGIINEIIKTSSTYIIFFLLYLILKSKVEISAGDMKLYSLLVNFLGVDIGLKVIFISLIMSIFPLLKGVKKVPMAFVLMLSFTAFLFLK